jgi:hypothetical protein
MDTNLSKLVGKNDTKILLPEDQHGSETQTTIVICAIFTGLTISTLVALITFKCRKHMKIREAMRVRTAAVATSTTGRGKLSV